MFRKSILSILIAIALILSLSTNVFATTVVTDGTWHNGVALNDPVPPFSGYITDSNSNIKTLITSPFNGNNIVTKEQMKKIEAKNKDKNKKGTISPNDWWSGDYYYEYIPNSYTQTSYMRDNYKFYVGGTSFYNSTPNNATLQYKQQNSFTSSWNVTAQISATAELKTEYLAKLGATLGGSYSSSTTTSSTTEVLSSITVPPGKTGYIDAWLPGGYSEGTARYKEYLYYNGYFFSTGNTVTTNESGWSPISNTSPFVLNMIGYTIPA